MQKKILIVDDDKIASDSLANLLRLEGFQVEIINQPKEVFEKVKFIKPDIILLDLLMPNLGGFELLEILNKDQETKHIPLIVVSALSNPVDIRRAYRLGILSYITKPYDFKELLREIKKTLGLL
ncbi:MAG: response regulator [Candidatus Omnitrophica bacterium]|nr:response regulator [Candidatus Omnitrophota bacterium]